MFRQTIAGQILVGTYCKFTNQGGLVHPGVSVEDLDELSSLLQVGIESSQELIRSVPSACASVLAISIGMRGAAHPVACRMSVASVFWWDQASHLSAPVCAAARRPNRCLSSPAP